MLALALVWLAAPPSSSDPTQARVIPTTSLWECQARAESTREGLVLRLPLSARAVQVREVLHPTSTELVRTASGWFELLSQELPSAVQTPGRALDQLAWVVRLDAAEASGPLECSIEDRQRGRQLLLRTLEHCELRSLEGAQSPIRVDALRIDQLAVVEARPVEGQALDTPTALEALANESQWLVRTSSQLPEGFTRTLLVEWQSTAQRPVSAPERGPFFDVSSEAGIANLHWEGPALQLDIRPTMGPGAALADFDGDGWLDLFLPAGGGRPGSQAPRAKLYKNLGGLRFADISNAAGLAIEGAGMGALAADFDGDNDLDLLVTHYGLCRLFENDGQARFREISDKLPQHGVERWWTTACAADYDRDGDLDVYITAYLQYDESKMPPAEELDRYQREDPMAMLPFAFPGEKKLFLENRLIHAGQRSALSFVDRTDELRLGDETGRGMQALWWDFDRDGDQDLYLANDVSPNRLWRNEGTSFKDVSLGTGLDDPRGSMGLAAGDIDSDGDEDLFITNWQLESNALYLNNLKHNSPKSRVSAFRDVAVQAQLAQASVGVTGWGAEFVDLDLDGDLDLVYANGYTSPDYESTGICVGQAAHAFQNDGSGRFTRIDLGTAFERPLANRCLLAHDLDRDGDLDLVLTANNGPTRILENRTARAGQHWLGLRLEGKGTNTRAIGAEVELQLDKSTLVRSMRAGTGYLGGNAPELHFGLGSASAIRAVEVRWPDGTQSTHSVRDIDRWITLQQPR